MGGNLRLVVVGFIVLIVCIACAGWAINYAAAQAGIDFAGNPIGTGESSPDYSTELEILRVENAGLRADLERADRELDKEREQTEQLRLQLQIAEAEAQKVANLGTADFQRNVGEGVQAILESDARENDRESAGDLWEVINPVTMLVGAAVIFLFGVGVTIALGFLLAGIGIWFNRSDKPPEEGESVPTE